MNRLISEYRLKIIKRNYIERNNHFEGRRFHWFGYILRKSEDQISKQIHERKKSQVEKHTQKAVVGWSS